MVKILGRHKGIIYYTVGQRKGLGISNETPLYVLEIRPESNQVVLGSEEHLYKSQFTAKRLQIFRRFIPIYAMISLLKFAFVEMCRWLIWFH